MSLCSCCLCSRTNWLRDGALSHCGGVGMEVSERMLLPLLVKGEHHAHLMSMNPAYIINQHNKYYSCNGQHLTTDVRLYDSVFLQSTYIPPLILNHHTLTFSQLIKTPYNSQHMLELFSYRSLTPRHPSLHFHCTYNNLVLVLSRYSNVIKLIS